MESWKTRVQSIGLFSKPFQCMTKQLESNLLGKFIAHYQWVVTDNNYAICNKLPSNFKYLYSALN